MLPSLKSSKEMEGQHPELYICGRVFKFYFVQSIKVGENNPEENIVRNYLPEGFFHSLLASSMIYPFIKMEFCFKNGNWNNN